MVITYEELRELGCEDSSGRIRSGWIRKIADTDIERDIISSTKFLLFEVKLSTRVLALKQQLTEHPLCYCGKPVMVHPTRYATHLFGDCCSRECAATNPSKNIKMKETSRQRYGCDYHQQSEAGKTLRETTNLARYGHASPAKNAEIRQKIKNTNMQRHGAENVFSTDAIKRQIAATNISRYGHESHQTATLTPDVHDKLTDYDWLVEQNHTLLKTLSDIASELNCSVSCVHQHFQRLNIDVRRHSSSTFERQVGEFIKSMGIDIETDVTVNGVRYDIAIPSHRLLIECDGIYWHSEGITGRGRTYHLNKTTHALSHDYRLIHVFEHEWSNKRDVVESIIANKLGRTATTIYARKTQILIPDQHEAFDFLEKHHLQGGNVARTIRYGLYHEGNLVALMTLSKQRYGESSSKTYELTRFCVARNTHVVGGFSKLLNYVLRVHDMNNIITFADRRYGEGSVYGKAGFVRLENTNPSYSYFRTNDCLRLFNRQQFQKHKLSSLLDNFDPEMSEWQNMKASGFDRIWDCGHAKWVLHC